jgi:uncharacterized protein
MKEIFQEMMREFQTETLPAPLRRDITLPQLPQHVRKAFVYIGMRRSGKTWALYQRMVELMAQGISKTQLLYINFEDDRLNGVALSDLQSVLEAYWESYPEQINNKKLFFFFDEIAEIDGWESFIRRLLEKEHMQIYITGSSAKMLSKEIATSLRGRTITREIFPMSFQECRHGQRVEKNKLPTIKEKAIIKQQVHRYLLWGGFPEVLDAEPALHREILQSYINTVIYRDIIERYQVKNHVALRQLLLYCLQNAAGLLSINKFFKQLKSRGISVTKDALYQYAKYFEDAYCVFSVPVYRFSLNKSESTPKKIYPIDTGLITAYSIKPGYDKAALLETAVFLHLRRQHDDIYYYPTPRGKEVDFLTMNPNGQIALYQASLSLKDEKTKQREVSAMIEAMKELQLTQATIVTMETSETLQTEAGEIHVIPLWQLLLSTP